MARLKPGVALEDLPGPRPSDSPSGAGAPRTVRGKAADVHPLMWCVAVLFIVYFAINPITDWIT